MTLKLIIHESAGNDLYELAVYLDRQSPGLSQRFSRAARQTMDRMAVFPYQGSHFLPGRASIPELRWLPIDGFPNHLIFYRVAQEQLIVVRIIHGARELESILVDPPI